MGGSNDGNECKACSFLCRFRKNCMAIVLGISFIALFVLMGITGNAGKVAFDTKETICFEPTVVFREIQDGEDKVERVGNRTLYILAGAAAVLLVFMDVCFVRLKLACAPSLKNASTLLDLKTIPLNAIELFLANLGIGYAAVRFGWNWYAYIGFPISLMALVILGAILASCWPAVPMAIIRNAISWGLLDHDIVKADVDVVVHSMYGDTLGKGANAFDKVSCMFCAQVFLFVMFTISLEDIVSCIHHQGVSQRDDQECAQPDNCGYNHIFWLLSFFIQVAGCGQMGKGVSKSFWWAWLKQELRAKPKDMEDKDWPWKLGDALGIDYGHWRCGMDLAVNGVVRISLFLYLPIFCAGIMGSIDFVKDCVALQFICCLDDLPSPYTIQKSLLYCHKCHPLTAFPNIASEERACAFCRATEWEQRPHCGCKECNFFVCQTCASLAPIFECEQERDKTEEIDVRALKENLKRVEKRLQEVDPQHKDLSLSTPVASVHINLQEV